MGSLLTAVASWLQARSASGAWLLRIDDLDAPRCPPGATDEILRQLEAHGLAWDEAVRYQSRHVADYAEALEPLAERGLTYRCTCTRAVLAETSLAGPDGPVYCGACARQPAGPGRAALRARLGAGASSASISIDDRWAGTLVRDVTRQIGDVVVKRADGQIAYQWACVVDDETQRITEVIRGKDLLGSSFQQAALMRLRAQVPPAYGHLPVIVDAQGLKLSKQNHAAPVDSSRAIGNLLGCLALLGLPPDPALRGAPAAQVLDWALPRWVAARFSGSAQTDATITYNAVQQTGFFK